MFVEVYRACDSFAKDDTEYAGSPLPQFVYNDNDQVACRNAFGGSEGRNFVVDRQQADSLMACERACNSSQDCKAYEFNRKNSVCEIS